MLSRAVLLFLSFALLSCQDSRHRHPSNVVVDDIGTGVHLSDPPHRIVSMAPSLTETLFALGLDSAIVGVTDFCDYPADALSKAKIGGIANPNLEQIVQLKPDLVLMSASGNLRGDYDKLQSLGLTIFVSHPKTVDGIFKSILDIGSLTGNQTAAESLAATLNKRRDRLTDIARSRPKKSVLLLISLQPIIAVGEGTFLGELLQLANATNAAGTTMTPYPMLSREEIVMRQPEVLLVTDDLTRNINDVIRSYPEWKELQAVRRGNVLFVRADLVGRPGPRVMEALAELVAAIHGLPTASQADQPDLK
jgi:iron complex transport system substrate-binding protein